jgi:hypothetical protein
MIISEFKDSYLLANDVHNENRYCQSFFEFQQGTMGNSRKICMNCKPFHNGWQAYNLDTNSQV